jgi:hypothetical protein
MSDLYDTDVVTWAEQQADALRRRAANEIDWDNVAEEIEDVGRSEMRAITSALRVAMQHKLYLLGWPNAPAARRWEIEARNHLAIAHHDFRESMRGKIDLASHYRRARLEVDKHILDEGPPVSPLPAQCPWSLDELLDEGRAAMGG